VLISLAQTTTEQSETLCECGQGREKCYKVGGTSWQRVWGCESPSGDPEAGPMVEAWDACRETTSQKVKVLTKLHLFVMMPA